MKEQKLTTTNEQLNKELKKNSLVLNIFYALFICIVAILLVFSYFSIFSDRFYFKNFNHQYIVGIGSSENFVNAKNGQLFVISKYNSTMQINIGDEIYYSKNIQKGSGIVQSVNNSTQVIELKCGEQTVHVYFSSVLGKIDSKVDGIGYIVWFIQSKAGVITFNVVLIAIVTTKILLNYFIETSAKGRELKKKLKEQKRELKQLSKNHKKYKDSELNVKTFDMLSGTLLENKQKLTEMSQDGNLSNAYSYLLSSVHEYYMLKDKLDLDDKEKITNCVELMTLANEIGVNEEYMLTDLILKSGIYKFDTKEFLKSGKEFFNNAHAKETYQSFLIVLYVLCKNNKSEIDDNIYDLCSYIQDKIKYDEQLKNDENLIKICELIKKI